MKTIYVCEMCGKHFEDYSKCIDHEEAHVRPSYAATKPAGYDNVGQYSQYPSKLHVKMTNDAVVCYRFERIVELSGDSEEAVANVG